MNLLMAEVAPSKACVELLREGGGFDVLDWRGTWQETTADYEELLTRLWRRELESVELVGSDGAEAIRSAAQTVYPGA